jgi:hypothetical protein
MRRLITLVAMIALTATGIATFGSGNAFGQPIVAGPTCDSTWDDSTWNSVVVPANATCVIVDSHIGGSVTISPGASFYTCNDWIQGSVNANGAYLNIDHGTGIGGSVSIINPGTSAAAGDKSCEIDTGIKPSEATYYSSLICPHYIGGSLSEQNLSRNRDGLLMGGCFGELPEIVPNNVSSPDSNWGGTYIGGSVLMAGNRSDVELRLTKVKGNVTCANDNPNSVTEDVWAFRIVGCGSPI